jgi:hypothetical protein
MKGHEETKVTPQPKNHHTADVSRQHIADSKQGAPGIEPDDAIRRPQRYKCPQAVARRYLMLDLNKVDQQNAL